MPSDLFKTRNEMHDPARAKHERPAFFFGMIGATEIGDRIFAAEFNRPIGRCHAAVDNAPFPRPLLVSLEEGAQLL